MCKRQRGETAKIKENFSLKFNLWDLAAVVLTVALSVGIYAIYRPYSHAEKTGLVAYVYADGSLIDGGKIPLSSVENTREIIISKDKFPNLNINGEVTVTIDRQKGIAITNSSCPNHDCVKQGFIDKADVPVVCAPNSVVAVLKSEDVDIDAPDAIIGRISP